MFYCVCLCDIKSCVTRSCMSLHGCAHEHKQHCCHIDWCCVLGAAIQPSHTSHGADQSFRVVARACGGTCAHARKHAREIACVCVHTRLHVQLHVCTRAAVRAHAAVHAICGVHTPWFGNLGEHTVGRVGGRQPSVGFALHAPLGTSSAARRALELFCIHHWKQNASHQV